MATILISTMLSRPLSWTMTWTWTPSYLALSALAPLVRVSPPALLLLEVLYLLQGNHVLQMSII